MSDTRQETGRRQGPRVVEVGEEAAGQRIDNFLNRELRDVPRSRLYRMIRKGEVRINGGRTKPTVKLKAGDRIRIPPVHIRPPTETAFIGSRQLDVLKAAILHEDDRMLVLNKPAGFAVHGGSGVSFGVIEGLRRLRPRETLELVHRLDRETSGCLLVAKRRSTLRTLHDQIRKGTIRKHYRLIARGHWPDSLTEIDAPLHRFVTASGERRVRVSESGKPSRTTFEVDAHGTSASLVRAELHTGRTHQIRVHCLHAGHGILGDEKYATESELEWDRRHGIERLCLHAERITLPEDAGSYQAPLPEDFQQIWQRLDGPASADPGSEDREPRAVQHGAQGDEG